MFGGWYIVALRKRQNLTALALVLGPTATRNELTSYLPNVHKMVDGEKYAIQSDDTFEIQFIVADEHRTGIFNSQAWGLRITSEPWGMT